MSCANKATQTKFLHSGICFLDICLICNGKAPLARKQMRYVGRALEGSAVIIFISV